MTPNMQIPTEHTADTANDPRIWLIENEDLWDNVGDHIEFHCPLEQVPATVIEAAEAYRKSLEMDKQQNAILDKMGIPREQSLPMPNLDDEQ